MRRIDVRSTDQARGEDGRQAAAVPMHGPEGEVLVASAEDVTFPAVWQGDERLYDVEIWRDGELVATVPPRSDDVDASFEEHERRRGT
jgi:hypothetical protein